jgi:biotin carboxylase
MPKPSAIIHIGAGHFQVASICWAQEAGLFTVATDRKPNAPGAAQADRFVSVAGDDTGAILQLAREVSKDYTLADIWGHADFCLMPRALVLEALGLPGLAPETVAAALKKDRAKLVWQASGVATPCAQVITSAEQAHRAAQEIGFPSIMKPLDASGSMGITRMEDSAAIDAAFVKARAFGKSILVEAYLTGREFGVNGIFHEGQFHPCGMSERRTDDCRITEITVPAPLSQDATQAVYGLLEDASRSLGINQGCVKGDCILVGDKPFIIEMAPRLHGNPTMSHAVPLATGMNPIRAWFGIAAGEDDPLRHIQANRQEYAGYRPLFCQRGVISAVQGLEQAKAVPGIAAVEIFVKPGQTIMCHGDNRDIAGYLFAVAKDPSALRGILDEAQAIVRIEL